MMFTSTNVLQALRRAVPLGVVPVGLTNSFGKRYFGSDKEDVRYSTTVFQLFS